MIIWLGWCPNRHVPFGYTYADLVAKICPKCSQALIPEHLTEEQLKQKVVEAVEATLDGL
jgi:hypothetical protein